LLTQILVIDCEQNNFNICNDSGAAALEDAILDYRQEVTSKSKRLSETINSDLNLLTARIRSLADEISKGHLGDNWTVGKSKYKASTRDVNRLKEIFPGIPDFLSDRLGKAISARRGRLQSLCRHHQELAEGAGQIGNEQCRTDLTTGALETLLQQKEASTTTTGSVSVDKNNSQPPRPYHEVVDEKAVKFSLPHIHKGYQDSNEYYQCSLCFKIRGFASSKYEKSPMTMNLC